MPMTKKRILVVDDEQDLCEILLFNLRAAGFEAEAANSAGEAQERLLQGDKFDLLMLDVMMPVMSGFELAELLKRDARTAPIPIIFLTAKDTEDDTLQGFGLGADDYVTKPFFVREVVARVKAVLNRSQPHGVRSAPMLQHEGLTLDEAGKRVSVDGEDVALTKTEFELLSLLMKRRGQVLSRQELLDGAWPHDVVVTDRTVDVNITRLRKKLGRYALNIVARQGFGYMFE